MTENNANFSKKCFKRKREIFYLPRRYIIVLLGFIGVLNIFAMRVSGSMTIVAMVNQTAMEPEIMKPENISANKMSECSDLIHDFQENTYKIYKGGKYLWDAQTQGAILGAYYYGYASTQVLGGVLAESFGVKWVFGIAVLVTALISLLTPTVASFGALAFAALRAIQGSADGLTLPSINFAISSWSPKMERSRISSFVFCGAQLGTVCGLPIAGFLCSTDIVGGWPSVFYVSGSVACVWFLFWCLFMYETPSIHPSISKEELLYIEQNKVKSYKKKTAAFWKDVFSSKSMWALIIAHTGHMLGFNIFLMQLPTYLSSALHFDLQSNGFLSSLPFLLQAIGMYLSSFVADILRKRNNISITTIRKIFHSIGVFFPALCMIGITLAGCRPDIIIFLLSLAMCFNGSAYSGFNVTHVDMCPDFAGTLYAVSNSIGNTTGFLGPLFVGYFTKGEGTLANWNKVFNITAAVYIVTGLVFVFYGSAEHQAWGVTEEKQKKEDTADNKMSVLDAKSLQYRL